MSSAALLGADFAWPLWNNQEIDDAFEIDQAGGVDGSVITKVSRPWLFGYKPTKAPNGRSVLILGGGGYTQLMVGREGIAVARWLTGLGFTAFVLVHRFPNADTGPQAPLDDARQALRLINEAGSSPSFLGVCGLSSGGHLAAALLSDYPTVWATSAPIPKLAFAIIGYGPISSNAAGRSIVADKPPLEPPAKQALYDTVIPDEQLAHPAPPTFIVYSANDPVVPVVNAYRLTEGLTKAGGSVELHVFADAPHGFAMDTEGLPVSKWPSLCEGWMQQQGLLE
ncbi:Alpha/Beta hydrolase protein [Hypoxylon fuscum]|nr:Alpha/Beta hydrolase protein [Hypoxylon fuscum]